MASALYVARCLSVEGAVVSIELTIVHPDVAEFGTDRLFAWKLLHEWVSPADDGTDVELASRYVKSVKLSPLRNAKKAHVAKDFYSVARKGDANPTVTYTIVVTDPALLSGIHPGDTDEVYDFVESGKGDALTPPPKAVKPKTAKQKKPAKAMEIPDRTFADLRLAALEGIRKYGSWSDYLVDQGMIERWAETESDAQILSYLEYLEPTHRVSGACLVAIARLRSGQVDAAKALLSYAESLYQPADDYNYSAAGGLCALWWRLGQESRADELYHQIATELKARRFNHNQIVHQLFTILVRGARWDRAEQLIPSLLKEGSYRDDLLVPGVLTAWEDNPALFAKVMTHWHTRAASSSMQNHELSIELHRRTAARGVPEEFLVLLRSFGQVIDTYGAAVPALLRTEQIDPQRAVDQAQKLLADRELGSHLHHHCLAVLNRHAPQLADAFVRAHLPTWQKEGWGDPFLAAANRVELLQEHVKEHGMRNPLEVAYLLSDRAYATSLIKDVVSNSTAVAGPHFVHLVDLGERAFVEEKLRTELTRLAAEPTRNRDLPCRSFAHTAAEVGMPELGFAAIKLPGPAVRRYAASDMVRGAAGVGAYGVAHAALLLVPDEDSNGRVSSAIQGVLRGAHERIVQGPRAVPLAVCDVEYARALHAAGERDWVAWMLSAHRNRFSDDEKRSLSDLLATS